MQPPFFFRQPGDPTLGQIRQKTIQAAGDRREAVPTIVVFAGVLGLGDPPQPANGDDVAAAGEVGDRLLGCGPVEIEQAR